MWRCPGCGDAVDVVLPGMWRCREKAQALPQATLFVVAIVCVCATAAVV